METAERKTHWNKIYSIKQLNEVSWYQPIPHTSLGLVEEFELPVNTRLIDVGGGDSYLVDHLLARGFTNISVLDISEEAIKRAKARLGNDAAKVEWIVADIAQFQPTSNYDVWHDRAAFHFLTEEKDVEHYVQVMKSAVPRGGKAIIGTFSSSGPLKCSGLEVKQYSSDSMTETIGSGFQKVRCFSVDHPTPFDTTQNFQFCSFKRV